MAACVTVVESGQNIIRVIWPVKSLESIDIRLRSLISMLESINGINLVNS
jgi:hypothetical protein